MTWAAIVIHQLLPHQSPLDLDDEELLMLLGRITPTAMLAARHRLACRRDHAIDRPGIREARTPPTE